VTWSDVGPVQQCVAILAAGMLFCGGEAEPWRETIEGFLDAVGG
jgi:hypothetical protein